MILACMHTHMSIRAYDVVVSLHEEVEAAINAGPVSNRDRATAALALTYATEIDAGADLAKLGPALLSALEALQMSPRARASVKKVVTDDKPASRLDELRDRRARKGRAPDLDATAP